MSSTADLVVALNWLTWTMAGLERELKVYSLTTIKSLKLKRKSKQPLCVWFRKTSCVCVALFTKKH